MTFLVSRGFGMTGQTLSAGDLLLIRGVNFVVYAVVAFVVPDVLYVPCCVNVLLHPRMYVQSLGHSILGKNLGCGTGQL